MEQVAKWITSEKSGFENALTEAHGSSAAKEQALVDSVLKGLEKSEGKLKVKFLLDFSRGTRDVQGQSSCTKLLPLVEKYKVRDE